MASPSSPRVVVNPYAAAAGAGSPAALPTSPQAMAAMVLELQRSQAALVKLRAENRKYRVREELESAPMSGGILAWSEERAVGTMQMSNMCNGACLIAAAVGSFFIPGDTVVLSFARLVLVCYMVCVLGGAAGPARGWKESGGPTAALAPWPCPAPPPCSTRPPPPHTQPHTHSFHYARMHSCSFLGGVMISMELKIGSLQAYLRSKLGFLFTYSGRSCFIALCVGEG
jgi:hypothetical protein